VPSRDRLRRSVERKYRDDLRRLSHYWPAEEVTIEELSRGRRWVRLHSGDRHLFADDEVDRLLERVPFYFHRLMSVPITLRYVRDSTGGRYVVLGGPWQRRLVEILLRGDYSYDGVGELRVSEFMKLNREYRSLIFVSVSL